MLKKFPFSDITLKQDHWPINTKGWNKNGDGKLTGNFPKSTNDTRNNPIMLGTILPCNYSKASRIADKISPYALLKCQWNGFSIYKINLYSTEYLIWKKSQNFTKLSEKYLSRRSAKQQVFLVPICFQFGKNTNTHRPHKPASLV